LLFYFCESLSKFLSFAPLIVLQPFPLQQRADSGAENYRIERLGEIVVCTQFNAAGHAFHVIDR
jgi:hypothetical protein